MVIKPLPPRDYVRQALRYAPPHLIWRHRPREHFISARSHNIWNARYANTVAGNVHRTGHVQVYLNGECYKAHRLVWLIVRGEPVPNEMDHIDGDPANNYVRNLRAATRHQNMHNAKLRKDNVTGIRGVSRWARDGRYRSTVNNMHLGTFDTLEEATKVRRAAAKTLHGKFYRP